MGNLVNCPGVAIARIGGQVAAPPPPRPGRGRGQGARCGRECRNWPHPTVSRPWQRAGSAASWPPAATDGAAGIQARATAVALTPPRPRGEAVSGAEAGPVLPISGPSAAPVEGRAVTAPRLRPRRSPAISAERISLREGLHAPSGDPPPRSCPGGGQIRARRLAENRKWSGVPDDRMQAGCRPVCERVGGAGRGQAGREAQTGRGDGSSDPPTPTGRGRRGASGGWGAGCIPAPLVSTAGSLFAS